MPVNSLVLTPEEQLKPTTLLKHAGVTLVVDRPPDGGVVFLALGTSQEANGLKLLERCPNEALTPSLHCDQSLTQ